MQFQDEIQPNANRDVIMKRQLKKILVKTSKCQQKGVNKGEYENVFAVRKTRRTEETKRKLLIIKPG